MTVLQRKELEDSPLADLHAIASELGLEGFRTLRRADLISAILEAQGGEEEPAAGSGRLAEDDTAQRVPAEEALEPAAEPEPRPEPERRAEPERRPEPEEREARVTGVLDILPNGSGFVRVDPSGQSRDDVYVSQAQIR